MTDQKPKRRKCSSDCEYMLAPIDGYGAPRCLLRPGGLYHSCVYPPDRCRADAGALRRRAAEDPSGWEADELRARGLKA